MEQTFMKEKKILPLVLSMSLPMVISMAVNSLYNIVDSYFVAKLSEDAMTALALVFPIQNMINAIAIGFAIGINASVAYFLGAGDQTCADKSASQGWFLNLLHGIVLSILCIAIMRPFLRMFSSDETVVKMALSYSNRAFLFSPVIALTLVYEKLFQAVGKMKVSMFCMMCGFIANIILDPLMIFGIGLLTLLAYLIFCKTDPIPVKIKRQYLRPEKNVAMKLYSVGLSATLSLALPSLLISVLNGILAAFSGTYVLVLGVYYKLQTFIYLTANGIIQGVMCIGTILSWLIPAELIGLFTANAQTIQIGVKALHIISLGFVVSAVSVTCSGALEGLGKGTPSLYISLLRYVAIIMPAAYLFSRFLGADGVWYAFCFTEFVSAGLSYLIYRKHEAL